MSAQTGTSFSVETSMTHRENAPAPLVLAWETTLPGGATPAPGESRLSKVTVFNDDLAKTATVASWFMSLFTRSNSWAEVFADLGVPKENIPAAVKKHAKTFVDDVCKQYQPIRENDTTMDDYIDSKIPKFVLDPEMSIDDMQTQTKTWLDDTARVERTMADVLREFVTRTAADTAALHLEWVTLVEAIPTDFDRDLYQSAVTALVAMRNGHDAVEYKPYAAFKSDNSAYSPGI